jgi:serine protease AprX
MKTNKLSQISRILMIALVFVMLTALAGGMPASAAAPKQSSYIIQATNAELAEQLVNKYGGSITSRLDIINAVGANLSEDSVAQLRLEKGIVAITLNGAVKTGDDGKENEKQYRDNKKQQDIPATDYPNVVGANEVWNQGVIGSGVAVAVLDTGLGDLPALTQTVKNKSGRIVAWKDFIDNTKKPTDPNGHGSHVAGIIANSEIGADGEWNGIAPGVSLVGVRVLDETGSGTYESVISGLQWVIENKSRYNIRVINLSLISLVQSPYWADPLNQAVTKAWASGLTVIVAAGNNGPEAMSISVPGNNPYVVTVGAFTDNYTPLDWSDDYIAPFSSAGPTLDGFSKPDVVAPGAHMISITPPNSYLSQQYPDNQLKSNYFNLAGTSQATAVVSGIAALVLSDNPRLSPDQVKMRLTSNAYPWVDNSGDNALYSMWQQGAGRVNAPDAVFSDSLDAANQEMNIQNDLAGRIHYEGYAYYDEKSNTYHLRAPFEDWAGGYGTWDGKYGAWSGKYGAWSGKYGAWSGKYGAWSGKYGAWSGKYGAWSGKYGAWSGKYGAWSGKYGAWSGGYTSWSGKYGAWSGKYGAWSGKYGAWSGKYGAWSGKYGAWSGKYGAWSGNNVWNGSNPSDATFMANFAAGLSPNTSITNATITYFTEDPQPEDIQP